MPPQLATHALGVARQGKCIKSLTARRKPAINDLFGAHLPAGNGPNREHGADDPIGANTMTAPATVSGEVYHSSHWETSSFPGRREKPATRKSGDLPSKQGAIPPRL